MIPKVARLAVIGILLLALLIPIPSGAQVTGPTLCGTVTGPSGSVLANARVSVKNVATGQTTETRTTSTGIYELSNLAPGDYEVSVSAEGFGTNVSQVTVKAESKRVLDVALTATGINLTAPSLQDLGITPDQVARKSYRSGEARQARAHAQDSPTPWIARDGSFDCDDRHFHRRSGEKQHAYRSTRAYALGLNCGGLVLYQRIFRDSRAQDTGDSYAWTDPGTQDSGVDSWSRDDPDSDSGGHRLLSGKSW